MNRVAQLVSRLRFSSDALRTLRSFLRRGDTVILRGVEGMNEALCALSAHSRTSPNRIAQWWTSFRGLQWCWGSERWQCGFTWCPNDVSCETTVYCSLESPVGSSPRPTAAELLLFEWLLRANCKISELTAVASVHCSSARAGRSPRERSPPKSGGRG